MPTFTKLIQGSGASRYPQSWQIFI